MKILVAGGAGYVGSRLVPALLEHGHSVDVVDLLWFGNHLPGGIGLYNRDVFDLTESDLEPYERVVFIAGMSSVPTCELSPGKNFILNTSAPAYLAYIAKQAHVKRFVYASTCSIYEYLTDRICVEEDPPICKHPYGISKMLGEQAVLHLQDENFSVITLRKGTVCGYSPRMRLDLIINAMYKSAVRDGMITASNPEIWRPILGIADAAQAYVKAVEADMGISGAFNIASENYTVGQIAEIMANLMGVKLNTTTNPDKRNYKISIEKAKSILAFNPQQRVEQIVQELAANVDKFSDWDNPEYYNVKMVERLGI